MTSVAGPPALPAILGVFPPPEIRTGGHRRFLELIGGLEARGYRVLLLCDPAVRGRAGPLPGEEVPIFRRHRNPRLAPAWWRYRREVVRRLGEVASRRVAPEAVVVAFSTTDFFAARAVARRLSAPLLFSFRSNIVTVHRRFGMLYKEAKRFKGVQRFFQGIWKRFLEYRITRASQRLVFQSDYDREEVIRRNPWAAEKSVVIPNSMQASWFPEELALTNRSRSLRRLVFLGSLGERKGIQHLLPAMRELVAERGVDVTLEVIGFGGLEQWCRRYVSEHALEDRVSFVGRESAPLPRLAAADLLVVPSLYDSFPNTVLEALFVGTPVIGSDTSGIASILEAKELLFEPQNPTAIADAVESAARDPEAYRRLRQLCTVRRAHFDFDWVAAFAEVIEEMT